MILANVIYCFIVMATVITIVNYNRTEIMIINYDPKTFIVQATDLIKISYTSPTFIYVEINNGWTDYIVGCGQGPGQ